jgi:hypothetical protein
MLEILEMNQQFAPTPMGEEISIACGWPLESKREVLGFSVHPLGTIWIYL